MTCMGKFSDLLIFSFITVTNRTVSRKNKRFEDVTRLLRNINLCIGLPN